MKIYQLRHRQLLPTTLDEAWNFFSDPRNLQSITPKYMDFEVVRGYEEQRMEPGMIISYKVSPLFGVKLNWVTEITHVKEKEYFVDEQRFGPYKFWHHKHSFIETPDGVLMQDVVNYALPLGVFGRVANVFLVRNQLNEIFTYREKALKRLYIDKEPEPRMPKPSEEAAVASPNNVNEDSMATRLSPPSPRTAL